jgi:hypothetical protein
MQGVSKEASRKFYLVQIDVVLDSGMAHRMTLTKQGSIMIYTCPFGSQKYDLIRVMVDLALSVGNGRKRPIPSLLPYDRKDTGISVVLNGPE